jgi:hypothetical protein
MVWHLWQGFYVSSGGSLQGGMIGICKNCFHVKVVHHLYEGVEWSYCIALDEPNIDHIFHVILWIMGWACASF